MSFYSQISIAGAHQMKIICSQWSMMSQMAQCFNLSCFLKVYNSTCGDVNVILS